MNTERPALKALFDLAKISTAESVFATSWTTSSLWVTPDEALLNDALVEAYGEVINDNDCDYLEELPILLCEACVLFEATEEQRKGCAQYIRAAFEDLTECHQEAAA